MPTLLVGSAWREAASSASTAGGCAAMLSHEAPSHLYRRPVGKKVCLGQHKYLAPAAAGHVARLGVVYRTNQSTARVWHVGWRACPRLILLAGGARSSVLLKPLISILSALPEAAVAVSLCLGETPEPTFSKCVVVTCIQAPAHRQATKSPTVAPPLMGLALVAAFLGGGGAISESPCDQVTIPSRVRYLPTREVSRHRRALLIVWVAFASIIALLLQDRRCARSRSGKYFCAQQSEVEYEQRERGTSDGLIESRRHRICSRSPNCSWLVLLPSLFVSGVCVWTSKKHTVKLSSADLGHIGDCHLFQLASS